MDSTTTTVRQLSDSTWAFEQGMVRCFYIAGADRALKRPEHFAAYLGAPVDVKLYQPVDGSKLCTGTLLAYDDGDVTVGAAAGPVTFGKKDVALVRLHIDF